MGNGALAIGPKLPRPSSTLPDVSADDRVRSQRVLLALTQKGVSREDFDAWGQCNAMPDWPVVNEGTGDGDFLALLKGDKDVA